MVTADCSLIQPGSVDRTAGHAPLPYDGFASAAGMSRPGRAAGDQRLPYRLVALQRAPYL